MFAKLAIFLSFAHDLATARVAGEHWSFAAGGLAILIVGGLAALVLGYLCYARTTEGLTPTSRVILGALRTVSLIMLLLMISGAACTLDLLVTHKPTMLVVVDDSPSMTLPHAGTTRLADVQHALDSGLLTELGVAQKFDVRTVTTSGLAADSQPQDLAHKLVERASETADAPPDQILLISDGVELGNRPLDAVAREVSAPVNVLQLDQHPQRGDVKDIILQRIWAPPFAYANDRAMVSAEVRCIGFDAGSDVNGADASIEVAATLLSINSGVEKPVVNSTLKLKSNGEPAIARIEFKTGPATTGGSMERYLLKIVPKKDELTDLNNSASFNLDVRPEKIRVLFVEGEPSWEYRYIKQAMESDGCVQFHGLVRLPEQEWFYQGPEKRPDGKPVIKEPAKGFVGSGDELNYFDVMIMGDIDRKLLDQLGRFDMLDSFVKTHGGGLATIGGFHVYAAGNYDQTPLARMLPFDLIPEKTSQLINRFNVQVTTQGMMHPVMQLEADPQKNEEAWANLPWVEGGNAISAVKPGATLLMVHPTLKTKLGPRPIAAAWQYGRGRVLSSALDGTWHWRLGKKDEQDYHQRYWALLARWLAGDPRTNKPFGDLVVQDPALEAGAPALFFCVVRDSDGNPRVDATAEFTVEGPSQSTNAGAEKLIGRSASDPRLPGRYGFSFTPKTAGEYNVSVTITTAAGESNTQKRTYYVGPSRAEYLRPVPDNESLAALAKATGGSIGAIHVADTKNARSLALPNAPPTVTARTAVITLWRAPGLYVILIVCLLAEWLMRKRRGLS